MVWELPLSQPAALAALPPAGFSQSPEEGLTFPKMCHLQEGGIHHGKVWALGTPGSCTGEAGREVQGHLPPWQSLGPLCSSDALRPLIMFFPSFPLFLVLRPSWSQLKCHLPREALGASSAKETCPVAHPPVASYSRCQPQSFASEPVSQFLFSVFGLLGVCCRPQEGREFLFWRISILSLMASMRLKYCGLL